MIHFKIEDGESGWLHIEINAATEISFDVQIPKGGYQQLFERLCQFAPIAARLDSDLMEMYDDAGRTQPRQIDVQFVRDFAKLYRFANVNCALPGFEELWQGGDQ